MPFVKRMVYFYVRGDTDELQLVSIGKRGGSKRNGGSGRSDVRPGWSESSNNRRRVAVPAALDMRKPLPAGQLRVEIMRHVQDDPIAICRRSER